MSEPKVLKAIWGSPDKPLRIGSTLEIPAYVLENGTRVLSGRGMQEALNLGQSHGSKLIRLLSRKSFKPFIKPELAMAINSPLRFIRPGRGGKLAVCYEATILPEICDAILDARKHGVLSESELLVAEQCEILTRAFAKVGIIALIDEVTGYQEVRSREALQEILDKYLRQDFAAWAKRFPDEFYKQMFRLRGWQWRGMKVNRPSVVGKYTNDLVYQRLAPGILEELQRRNPKDEKGNREGKHHSLLTDDFGVPSLQQHLFATTKFMEASATWDQFYRSMQRAFPKLNATLMLNFPEEEAEA